MRVLFKLFFSINLFCLVACGSKSSLEDEEIMAVVTAPNGNLYILTETLDYEFPRSKAKNIKLFFELSPAFKEVGQPISARMWVKERSVEFSFDEAVLNINRENNYKIAENNSTKIRDFYSRSNKSNQLLKYLENLAKKEPVMKLAAEYENSDRGLIDYTFSVNKRNKNDKVKGKIINITNRKDIIKEYQSVPANIKEYRINIFYEPSVVKKQVLGRKIEKEVLIPAEKTTLSAWQRVKTLSFNVE